MYDYMGFIGTFTKSGAPVRDLSRFSNLMQLLGNPERLLRHVHVAGTNGKGSVCEFISAGLAASGKKVGKFTSPFITHFEQRFQLNDRPVAKEKLALCMSRVAEGVDKNIPYSQFELEAAAAFLLFLGEKCDLVVLETGIGGDLDCTNIVTPELSVITSVDVDHRAILGNTPAEIAVHKAGIIKPDRPAVTAVQRPEVLEVLRRRAAKVGARLVECEMPEQISSSLDGTRFRYKNQDFFTAMAGEHQAINAAAAIEALRLLGAREDAIKTALLARLQARLELLENRFLIDGGHNAAAAAATAKLLRSDPRGKIVIVGVLTTKDCDAVLGSLLPTARFVIAADFFAPNALPASDILRRAQTLQIPCAAAENAQDALDTAMKIAEKSDLICTLGSLYLAGEIRSLIK